MVIDIVPFHPSWWYLLVSFNEITSMGGLANILSTFEIKHSHVLLILELGSDKLQVRAEIHQNS